MCCARVASLHLGMSHLKCTDTDPALQEFTVVGHRSKGVLVVEPVCCAPVASLHLGMSHLTCANTGPASQEPYVVMSLPAPVATSPAAADTVSREPSAPGGGRGMLGVVDASNLPAFNRMFPSPRNVIHARSFSFSFSFSFSLFHLFFRFLFRLFLFVKCRAAWNKAVVQLWRLRSTHSLDFRRARDRSRRSALSTLSTPLTHVLPLSVLRLLLTPALTPFSPRLTQTPLSPPALVLSVLLPLTPSALQALTLSALSPSMLHFFQPPSALSPPMLLFDQPL